MATANATTRPSTIRPAHGSARLIIEINGTAYRVRQLRSEDRDVRKAYRLRKADGTTYDVARTIHGNECTCADFTFRRDGIDPAGCKHIKALVAWKLLARGRRTETRKGDR